MIVQSAEGAYQEWSEAAKMIHSKGHDGMKVMRCNFEKSLEEKLKEEEDFPGYNGNIHQIAKGKTPRHYRLGCLYYGKLQCSMKNFPKKRDRPAMANLVCEIIGGK